MALLLLPPPLLRSAARSPPAASRRSSSTGTRRHKGRAMAAAGRLRAARPTPAAAARGHCPPPSRRGREGGTAGGSDSSAQEPARCRFPRSLKGAAPPAAASAGERGLARRDDAVSSAHPVPGRAEVKRLEATRRVRAAPLRRGAVLGSGSPRCRLGGAGSDARVCPCPGPALSVSHSESVSCYDRDAVLKINTLEPALPLSWTELGQELMVSVRPGTE